MNSLVFGFDARNNTININNTTNDSIDLLEPDVSNTNITSIYHKPSILPDPLLPTTVSGETKYYAMVGESLSNDQTNDNNTANHNYYHIRIKNIGTNNLNISNSITIQIKMFVNQLNGTSSSPNMIFCRRSNYTDGIILFMNQSNIVLGLGTGGANRITFTNTFTLNNNNNLNKWINLTITVTNTESKLYFNENLEETISSSNYTVNLSNTDVNADLLIGSGNPSAAGLYTLDGYVQSVKIFNTELTSNEINSLTNEDVPCLTDSCNILTPNGYINITNLKENDFVITHDNRKVSIIKILKSISKNPPNKIKSHYYGYNKPIIDTYISDKHAYKVNNKWLIPKDQNLPKKNSINNIYYHLQLQNYSTDHLVINGLIMESWNGKYL